MDRILAAVTAGITGFFIFKTVRHMVRPGNAEYTRMLMFAFFATIPFVFLLGFVGGRNRIPHLLEYARDIAGPGPWSVPGIIGLASVVIVLPLVIYVSVWFVMELRSALLFVLYSIPLLLRMATATSGECITSAVVQAMLFLLTGPVGAVIVAVLERHKKNKKVEIYTRQVQKVWKGYDDKSSANMFVAVCLLALINQLMEFIDALITLVRGN